MTHCIDIDSWYRIGTPEPHSYERAECYPYAGFFNIKQISGLWCSSSRCYYNFLNSESRLLVWPAAEFKEEDENEDEDDNYNDDHHHHQEKNHIYVYLFFFFGIGATICKP